MLRAGALGYPEGWDGEGGGRGFRMGNTQKINKKGSFRERKPPIIQDPMGVQAALVLGQARLWPALLGGLEVTGLEEGRDGGIQPFSFRMQEVRATPAELAARPWGETEAGL